jgi:hypothetical protein
MTNTVIYINEEMVDVFANTVIAYTLQLGDIGDIRTRGVSYTNQFKLPITRTNKRILGFSQSEYSDSTIPYTRLRVKVIQNGIEIISNGVLIIDKVDELFHVAILDSTFDFFSAINGKYISELDFGEGLITWNDSKIDSCRKISGNTSALLCPVIQYGQFDLTGASFSMDDNAQLPSVRYSKIIEAIITNAGYSYSGDIFSNGKYLNMIVPYSRSRWGYGAGFKKNREFFAVNNTPIIVTNTNTTVTFDTIIQRDEFGMFDGGTGTYDTSVSPEFRPFNFGIFGKVVVTITSGTYNLFLSTSNVDLPSIGSEDYSIGTHEISVGYSEEDTESSLIPDPSAFYKLVIQPVVAGSCTVTFAELYNRVYDGEYSTTPVFNVEDVLPDITQEDFLKDFAIRFGLLFNEKNNVVYCTHIKDIINNKSNAVDWTYKRDVSYQDELRFDYRNYSQKNVFKYPSNDDMYKEGTSDGFFYVSNENIEEENDFYESIFYGTGTTTMTNATLEEISCAHIPVFDTPPTNDFTTLIFDNEPGDRLLLVREANATDPAVTINANSRTDYMVGYFNSSYGLNQMNFSTFIRDNYTELQSSLDKAKVITRYYRLSEMDIHNLDLTKLIFDNGAYYMISKIDNYKPGVSTKIELFKVL